MKHIAADAQVADINEFHLLSFLNLVAQITNCIQTDEWARTLISLGRKHIKWNFLWILFAFVSFIQRNYNLNFFSLLFLFIYFHQMAVLFALCCWETASPLMVGFVPNNSCLTLMLCFLNERMFSMRKPTICRKSIICWRKSVRFQ